MNQAVFDLLGFEFPEAGLNGLEGGRRPLLLADKVRPNKPFLEEKWNRSPTRGEEWDVPWFLSSLTLRHCFLNRMTRYSARLALRSLLPERAQRMNGCKLQVSIQLT